MSNCYICSRDCKFLIHGGQETLILCWFGVGPTSDRSYIYVSYSLTRRLRCPGRGEALGLRWLGLHWVGASFFITCYQIIFYIGAARNICVLDIINFYIILYSERPGCTCMQLSRNITYYILGGLQGGDFSKACLSCIIITLQ